MPEPGLEATRLVRCVRTFPPPKPEVEKLDERYIWRIVKLTSLAPDIVEAILEDSMPAVLERAGNIAREQILLKSKPRNL